MMLLRSLTFRPYSLHNSAALFWRQFCLGWSFFLSGSECFNTSKTLRPIFWRHICPNGFRFSSVLSLIFYRGVRPSFCLCGCSRCFNSARSSMPNIRIFPRLFLCFCILSTIYWVSPVVYSMCAYVLRSRNRYKVLGSVVVWISINMMDVLTGFQATAIRLLPDESVLKYVSACLCQMMTRHKKTDIASNATSSFPVLTASPGHQSSVMSENESYWIALKDKRGSGLSSDRGSLSASARTTTCEHSLDFRAWYQFLHTDSITHYAVVA